MNVTGTLDGTSLVEMCNDASLVLVLSWKPVRS